MMTEDMKLIETREKHGSPCPELWDWLPKSYNFDGNGSFTKYNMEVAFLAGKNSTPNHAPAVVRQLVEALEGMLRGIFDGPDESDIAMIVSKAKEALAAAKEARL